LQGKSNKTDLLQLDSMFLNNNSSCRALFLAAALLVCGNALAQGDFGGPGGNGPGGGKGPGDGKGPGKPNKEMAAPDKNLKLSQEVEKERVTIYCFGFAGSFKDSLSYMTDIQKLDSVELSKKSKFIIARESYSSQLSQYFKDRGNSNVVCAFFYDTKKSRLEKKYAKIRKRYEKAQDVLLRFVPTNEFKFERVEVAVFE
jgi:hypothetical protein